MGTAAKLTGKAALRFLAIPIGLDRTEVLSA